MADVANTLHTAHLLREPDKFFGRGLHRLEQISNADYTAI